MSTLKGAHYIAFLAIIILLAALLYAGKNYAVFKISEHFTGNVVYSKLVRVGDTFTLTYIHSVTKQPVYEVFQVEGKQMLSLVEMRYDSFGANLPVGSEHMSEESTSFTVRDGYYMVSYENRKFKQVPLMVGQVVADHTIVMNNGETFRMLDLTNGGTYVDIYVEPLLRK